jgi:hypothetical protein
VSATLRGEVYIELLCLSDVQEDDETATLSATCQQGLTEPTAIPDILGLMLESIRHEQHKKDKWEIAEWDCKKYKTVEWLAVDIQNSTATAIIDGSFKNENGTLTFHVLAEDDLQRIIGVNYAVPAGACKEQSAYRSELAGILGILMVLDILFEKFKSNGEALGSDWIGNRPCLWHPNNGHWK